MSPFLIRILAPALAVVSALAGVSCVAFDPIQPGDDLAGDRVMAYRKGAAHGRGSSLQRAASVTRVAARYRASAEQKAIAQSRATSAKSGYAQVAKSKGTKYVAVPVPRRKSVPAKKNTRDVMVIKADTGKLVSDTVYEVEAAPMDNSVTKIGDHDALLYSGYKGI